MPNTDHRLKMQVQCEAVRFQHELPRCWGGKTLETAADVLTIIAFGKHGPTDVRATAEFLLIYQ